jgi:hypothetical protein
MHVSRLQKILHRDESSLEPTVHVHWRAVPGVQHLLICPINKLEEGRGSCVWILHRVHKNAVTYPFQYWPFFKIKKLCCLGRKKKLLFALTRNRKFFNTSCRGGSKILTSWFTTTRTYALQKVATKFEARGSVDGSGTMLHDGRSRVRFPMRPFHFSIYLILPAALGPGVDSACNRNE